MTKKKANFYAVRIGLKPGIYTEWFGENGAQAQVNHYRGAAYQGFHTREEAEAYLGIVSGAPAASEEGLAPACPTDGDDRPPWDEPEAEAAAAPSPRAYVKPADQCPVTDAVRAFCGAHGFANLSDDQLRAVQTVEGKALLFAVPGSGKTTVVVARTGYMIHGLHINPASVMGLTFTRAAAAEMKERYHSRFGRPGETEPDFRTIHSLCWSILLPELHKVNYPFPSRQVNDPVDEPDEEEAEEAGKPQRITQKGIIRQILKKHVRSRLEDTDLNAASAVISCIKNRMLTTGDQLKATGEAGAKKLVIRKTEIPLPALYNAYQQQLTDLDVLDYDDMLWYAWDGLRKHPEVLRRIQARYRYWCVDEAQDNSLLQNRLMNLLAGPDGNLFMVGDDDQSIYAFRGAQPRLLLDFGEEPGVRKLIMHVNYRSASHIVDACRELIGGNKSRQEKSMQPSRAEKGSITVWHGMTAADQQYQRIVELARKADADHTLAVLYQMNISALPVMFHLQKSHIPFRVSKDIAEILRTKVIRDILGVLRFALNPQSVQAFWRCRVTLDLYGTGGRRKQLDAMAAAKPGQNVLDMLEAIYRQEQGKEHRLARISAIRPILTQIAASAPDEAIRLVMTELNYAQSVTMPSDRLALYGLMNISASCADLRTFIRSVDGLRETFRPAEQGEDRRETEGEWVGRDAAFVSLSTMHGAKGREFNTVVVIDALEDTLPGKPQPDRLGYDPEEPLRLFYVALTRARDSLEIMGLETYCGNTVRQSPYVWDFAALCRERWEDANILNKLPPAGQPAPVCVVEPTYYAIPEGPHRGVYTDWAEVQAYTDGTPHNSHRSGGLTRGEAEVYAYGAALEQPLRSQRIERALTGITHPFNLPMDLPENVTEGVLAKWQVPSLLSLSPEQIHALRSASPDYRNPAKTDYDGRTDSYVLLYFPVNFYKVWQPLSELLRERRLKREIRVLELGAGPGTASLGLFSFYRALALDHPELSFSVDLRAVEAVAEFRDHFRRIKKAFDTACPPNLTASARVYQKDAFVCLGDLAGSSFDLILESNMLNAQEGNTGSAARDAMIEAASLLAEDGVMICIEPGTRADVAFLGALASQASGRMNVLFSPEYHTADVSAVGLNLQASACGLRWKPLSEHAFSTLVLSR